MKRRAIIIEASSVSEENYIYGAKKDASNWVKFLTNDIGGDWLKNDVTVLHTPTKAEVIEKLTESSSDYLFVAFSGHGGIENGDEVICLKDGACSILILMNLIRRQSSKATLILDCCRASEDADVMIDSDLSSSSSSRTRGLVEGSTRTSTALPNTRTFCKTGAPSNWPTFEGSIHKGHHSSDAWFKALNKCDEGLVTMWACSKGESAGEDSSMNPDVGGYFTTALIVAAKNWNNITEQLYCAYYTKEAFDDAPLYIPDSQQQHPVYLPPELSFPFAISSL